MFPAEASVLLAFLLVALAVIVGLSVYVRRLLNKGIVCVCVCVLTPVHTVTSPCFTKALAHGGHMIVGILVFFVLLWVYVTIQSSLTQLQL